MPKVLFIFLIISLLNSCRMENSRLGIVSIPPAGWPAEKSLDFHFSVEDTAGTSDLLYQLQLDPEFAWENIWLRYCLLGPGGDTLIQSTDNLFLFEPGSGKPLGRGCRERLYLNAYFLRNVRLRKPGKYTVLVQHRMRTDTLNGLQALGIRVQDAEK